MRHLAHIARPLGALSVLAGLGLAACAAQQNDTAEFQAYVGRWVGKPVSQLEADWGKPDYETAEDGQRELQYGYSEAVSWGQRPIRITCTTKFKVGGSGNVESVDISGNACSTKNLGPASRGY
jgi:hypothetical protein